MLHLAVLHTKAQVQVIFTYFQSACDSVTYVICQEQVQHIPYSYLQ